MLRLLTVLFLSFLAPAQQPRESDPVFKVDATVFQVDAVVTDAKGQVVSDLEARDFEVVEKGKSRAVDYCSFIPLTGDRAALGPKSDGRLLPEELRRSFVFVISIPSIDIDLGGEATANFRAAALRGGVDSVDMMTHFVENRMQPGDLVGMVKVDQASGLLAQLTNDRTALKGALAKMRAEPIARDAPSIFIRTTPSITFTELGQQNLRAIRTARTAVDLLAGLPGRKTVILAARFMLPNNPRIPEGQMVSAAMGELAQRANQAGVTIHTISLSGMQRDMFGNTDALFRAASETGGTLTENNHAFNSVVDRIEALNRGYYLLGYRLPENAGEPGKIKVRVKRSGLDVRARSSALGQGQAADKIPDPRRKVAAALLSPLALRDLPVSMAIEPPPPAGRGTKARLRYSLEIDTDKVDIGRLEGGEHGFILEITTGLAGPDGNWVKLETNTHYFRAPANIPASGRTPVTKSYEIEVDKSGYYQVRALVRDKRSNRAGNAARLFNVPAATGKQTASGN